MIKGILFDFGQTLVDSAHGFRLAEKTAKERIFADLFPEPEENSWGIFLPAYRRIRKEYHRRSRLSRPAIWVTVYRHFGRVPDYQRLDMWEADYWSCVRNHTTPFPETVPVLEDFAGRCRLALITNTQGQTVTGNHRIDLFPEIERFFEVIVVAGETGIPPKPDPEPFRVCLAQLGLRPQEAVFVGDDQRIDIGGAMDAGMHPVWLRHHSVQRNWPDAAYDAPVITDLNQLAAVVTRL